MSGTGQNLLMKVIYWQRNELKCVLIRDVSVATDSLQRTNPERERQELVPQNKKNWFFDSFFVNINQKYGHVNKIYKRTELRLTATYIDWVYNVLKDSANER